MLTFIVMPCLDEAEYVRAAASSLLAPAVAAGTATRLIAVDNGSSDGTLEILAELGRTFPDRVVVVEEPRRGFVPPRRSGVDAVAEMTRASGVEQEDVLVLQADADTIYRPGYVAAMEQAAAGLGNVILEGSTGRPADFAAAHPGYVAAERAVDAELERLEAADQDDVVVDDKVCSYRLSDYVRWGGLFEETDRAGDEVHAETTRMFVRARLRHGASKVRVNPAGAISSRRRIIEDPRYHFATLGFPRGATWRASVRSRWDPIGVDEFAGSVLGGGEAEAVRLRRAHLLALFRHLPAYVRAAAEGASVPPAEDDMARVLSELPRRSAEQFASAPGRAIADVLALIDRSPELFDGPLPASA